MEQNKLTIRASQAFRNLVKANEKATQDLIDIVKDAGGMIVTDSQFGDKPILYAVVDYNGPVSYQASEFVPIHAIAFDEGEGLMILTDWELENYTSDTGYCFEYYNGFEGEDLEHFQDCVKDITYFRAMDDGYTDEKATIFNILAGLADYLA